MERILIGVLLDVSGSMEHNAGKGTKTRDGEWARSIFTVVDNLIKHDLEPNNYIFAIGFGASREEDPSVFDLIGSLDDCKNVQYNPANSLWGTVDEVLSMLESNGANNVRKWAPKDILMDALEGQENQCDRILERLQRDGDFVQYVVNDCLPPICRDVKESEVERFTQSASAVSTGASLGFLALASNPTTAPIALTIFGVSALTSIVSRSSASSVVTKPMTDLANQMNNASSSAATTFVTATKEDIDNVVDKIEKKMRFLEPVSGISVFEILAAHRILRGHVGDKIKLTKKRIDELMDKIRPYIYGYTPLNEALQQSLKLFAKSNYCDHKKLLFILSDGYPSDNRDFHISIPEDITAVGCFITSSDIDPYVLYSSEATTELWERGPRFLFNLSSAIPTQDVPRTIFVKRKWTVEMINNETQLFLQVNHPDHLKDACDFARQVVTSQEALSDVLASVNLDVYINQSNDQFNPQEQVGPTCYANASATVMHLAMNRILGRDGGVPDFASLRDDMINCYSKQPGCEQGADTEVVLQEMCPQYRLRCKKVGKKMAMRAIMEKRPVVARFRLTKKEWNNFGSFFGRNKKCVLTSDDIKTYRRSPCEKTRGHAVVLTSFNSKCLRFMNSWGTDFADDGFFNVQDADVLGFEFYDIYWDETDLKPAEKDYYDIYGSDVAAKLMKTLTGLKESTFECPNCKRTSKVTEFEGRLSCVTCPKCLETFECGTKGNVLALNLYLTSLVMTSSEDFDH